MKKSLLTLTISAALALSLTGCGIGRPAQNEAPNAAPEVTAEAPAPTQDATPVSTSQPAAEPVRQDGERFDTVIILEGMEETVHYEHIRNEAAGIEMDYDYESFRHLIAGRGERFVSVWDDPEHPENYLELTASPRDAAAAAASIGEELSQNYDITTGQRTLERAGECLWIEASVLKGTNQMADRLQTVYVIPAADGCRIAAAHCSIESSEGFGRRFDYMLQTLTVIDRAGDALISDELALSAIRNYCYAVNPDLEGIVKDGTYPVTWEIASGDGSQVVVLFRSYTGAEIRYYIDRASGDTYVTEFVPGITPAEERTEETLNAWEYAY